MDTQKLLAIFQVGFKIAAVALVILTLGLSGVGSAERLYAAGLEVNEDSAPPVSQHAGLKADPLAEPPDDGMAPGSHPHTEQTACLQSPLTLTSGGGDYRVLVNDTCRAGDVVTGFGCNCNRAAATSSQVNSHLGRQFTLVGAKPSGTS